MTSPSLAERKRQLVVDELTEAALQLLATKGFDTTTVDEIVVCAGVSRRTFFRYFASKEDVVVQLLASLGELMHAELAARPADEPIATSLYHAVATAIDDCAGHTSAGAGTPVHRDPAKREKALRVAQMVVNTPALLARYLERQAQWQADLAALLSDRYGIDDLHAELTAGMALTACQAVIRSWSDSNGTEDPFALLNRAFRQIGPAL